MKERKGFGGKKKVNIRYNKVVGHGQLGSWKHGGGSELGAQSTNMCDCKLSLSKGEKLNATTETRHRGGGSRKTTV